MNRLFAICIILIQIGIIFSTEKIKCSKDTKLCRNLCPASAARCATSCFTDGTCKVTFRIKEDRGGRYCEHMKDCESMCPKSGDNCFPRCQRGRCWIAAFGKPVVTPVPIIRKGKTKGNKVGKCESNEDCQFMCPKTKGKCKPKCDKGNCSVGFLPPPTFRI